MQADRSWVFTALMISVLGSCRSRDPRAVPERCAEPAQRAEHAESGQLVEEQARSPRPYQEVAILSAIRLLSSLDPASFAGHAVDLADVPVRAATDQGLWVGFGRHSELFLVPLHAGQLAGIEAGDRIAIRGTVQELPEAEDDAKQPELAPARARGEKVYLEASEVTKLAPRPEA